MSVLCPIARRLAAAHANDELGKGLLAKLVKSHFASCEECSSELAAFREVAEALSDFRCKSDVPNTSWEAVRARILESLPSSCLHTTNSQTDLPVLQRQKEEAGFFDGASRFLGLAARRRLYGGLALCLIVSVIAGLVWFGGSSIVSDSRRATAPATEVAKLPDTLSPPKGAAADKVSSELGERESGGGVKELAHPIRNGASSVKEKSRPSPVASKAHRVASTEAFDKSTSGQHESFSTAEVVAVELSPNSETGVVEAAVVPSDENSLLIET